MDAARQYQLAPDVLVRFNPLPPEALPAADEFIVEVLERLDTIRRWRTENRQPLIDALEGLVARAPDRVARQRLIAAKRAVFNDRPLPAARKDAPDVERIVQWRGSDIHMERLGPLLDVHHRRVVDDERRTLLGAAACPSFSAALELSTPALARDVERLRDPNPPREKQRSKTYVALLQYVARAATRTSPYSSYTVVAHGTWKPGSVVLAPPPAWSRAVEVNLRLLWTLLDRVTRSAGVVPYVRLRLAQSRAASDPAVLEFEALSAASQRYEDLVVAKRRPSTIARTTGVDALLSLVEDRDGSVSGQQIVAGLRLHVGITAQEAVSLILAWMAAGLLEPVIPVNLQEADPLRQSLSWLENLPRSATLDQAVQTCRTAMAAKQRFPGASVQERKELARQVTTGFEQAGVPTTSPATTPLLEDVVSTPSLEVDPSWCVPSQAELGALMFVVEAFDPRPGLRRAFRREYVQRYGRGSRRPLITVASEIIEPVLESWLIEETSPGQPFSRLAILRQHLIDAVAGSPRDADIALQRTIEHLQRSDDSLSKSKTTSSSYAVLVQPSVGAIDARSSVFVNRVLSGAGRHFARFLPSLNPRVQANISARLVNSSHHGSSTAEYRPVYGFNANVHPLLAAYEISDHGDPTGSLRLDDLTLTHDPADDEVVIHDAEGRRIEPVYLATFSADDVPPHATLLYALGGGGGDLPPLGRSLWSSEQLSRSAYVTARPRVTVGRYVLARASWYVPAGCVPLRSDSLNDSEYLSTVDGWRRSNDLPSEVFVRRSTWSGKPQYLSLQSPTGLHLFDRWRRRNGGDLLFEEVAPALDESIMASAVGSHVCEVLFEVDHFGPPPGS